MSTRHAVDRVNHFVAVVSLALMMCAPQASAETASPGRVFLTFDDGPINVTLDILDVLKSQGIKATFFINAIHLHGHGGENEDHAQWALRRIVMEGHVLGNHSHDHMGHNRPLGVYSMTAAKAYLDVETDLSYFIPANITPVLTSLGPLAKRPNNRIATLARLPYSNVWMFPQLGAVCKWCGEETGPFWHPNARTNGDREVSDAGGKLAAALYQRYKMDSFGWDVHWKPGDWSLPTTNETMPPASEVEQEILALLKRGSYPIHTATATYCKAPVRQNNVIVLTHDFLFENGSRGRGRDANLPELAKLISSIKVQGYTFDTLDHYLD